jgi:hypothetical protein
MIQKRPDKNLIIMAVAATIFFLLCYLLLSSTVPVLALSSESEVDKDIHLLGKYKNLAGIEVSIDV